jgi:hypothetical protein
MTIQELESLFDKHEDEFLKFERIPAERRLSNSPDIQVFRLLDELFPGDDDLVSCATHDEIFLSIDGEEFASKVTEDLLIDMMRCGLRWDSSEQSLCVFV